MKKLIGYGLISISLLGCVAMTPRETKVVRIESTKKDSVAVISRALVSAGYRIKTVDHESGLVLTEPKDFIVSRGLMGAAGPARTSVQVIRQDNGIDLQLTHECSYPQSTGMYSTGWGPFQTCFGNDREANRVIPEHEREITNIVRVALGLEPIPPPEVKKAKTASR